MVTLTGLPKPLRDALGRLADQHRVNQLVTEMELHLQNLDPDAVVEEMPEYDPDREPNEEWQEGVEDFAEYTTDALWAYLGVSKIPFFNERYDLLNGQDGWSDAKVAEEIQQHGEWLVPRWHQLVGIAKMLTNAFEGKPVLLMDDVGIGKTLQVVGLVAVLSYYREYHLQHKKFPGHIGEYNFQCCRRLADSIIGQRGLKWPGGDAAGNIGNNGFAVMVPPSLQNQFLDECRRYLQPQAFDLLPYGGTVKSRPTWWTSVYVASNHQPSRRIMIGTTSARSARYIVRCYSNTDLPSPYGIQALVADMRLAFTSDTKSVAALSKLARNFDKEGKVKTLFGRHWTLAVVDEAHSFRKTNNMYRGALAMRSYADHFIGMTATPVQTRPEVCAHSYADHHTDDEIAHITAGLVEYRPSPRAARICRRQGRGLHRDDSGGEKLGASAQDAADAGGSRVHDPRRGAR